MTGDENNMRNELRWKERESETRLASGQRTGKVSTTAPFTFMVSRKNMYRKGRIDFE